MIKINKEDIEELKLDLILISKEIDDLWEILREDYGVRYGKHN